MSAGGGAPQHALSLPVSDSAVAGSQWSVMADRVSVGPAADGDEDEGCEPGLLSPGAAPGPADEPLKLGTRRRADRAASSESSDRSVTPHAGQTPRGVPGVASQQRLRACAVPAYYCIGT